MKQFLAACALALGSAALLAHAAAYSAEPERVQVEPRLEVHADGSRELVLDTRIEAGWILYASDFEQPQIGPRAARLLVANDAARGALQSIGTRQGKGRGFAGDYQYTYFSGQGQLRQGLTGTGPVTATLRAQVCFEESGLCELVNKEIVAR